VIVAIAYNQRFAMAIAVLQCLLIAVVLELPAGLMLAVLAGCVVAVAQLREVRQRFALIRMGAVSGLVIAVGVFAALLSGAQMVEGLYKAVATEALWALAGATVVGFFVLGVLPFIERAFKVTTAMTLLELGDMNHPLLKRLAQQAPGTFNHSLTLATIAEGAAEAIGANGLLARVGAYFHDCGKLNKPEYFIENQAGGPNKHAKLSPAMSLLIIVGHVKDGIEMAREYHLPPVINHFIESHHGTTLVEYFFHAAKKRQNEDDQPSEIEFRYPGPKPRTRETAILLLCDSVEAAIRTMPDPNPRRIEQFVHQMAMKRLMDGQFADSPITLAELSTIEEAITKSLCGIYHGRIAYPKDQDQAPRRPHPPPPPTERPDNRASLSPAPSWLSWGRWNE
jgi:putative nucleotidyltransferase with HDIG domain